MLRLAINGYGRIGRCVLRALYESDLTQKMQVVAINEPASLTTMVHLTKYDSTHGRFPGKIQISSAGLQVNNDVIAVSHCSQISELNWAEHDIDIVLECSGQFLTSDQLEQHILRGARRVLLSAPGEHGLKTIVMGLNQHALTVSDSIVSAASCTSNCVIPVIDILHRNFGIREGTITTIHSAMNDQPVIDAYSHTDLRKTRAAGQSIIPVDTGLAEGIGRVLPPLDGKFTARALRVPTQNVSVIELSVNSLEQPIGSEKISVESVNKVLHSAAENDFSAILGYSDEPLASCDFNHDPRSGIVDAAQTRVSGQMISVLIWFDNEWGYANRMLDVASSWLRVSDVQT
ncbi:MAG: D-erythrose 4-phosphate dehydrogenase [Oceanicoccus sp.]|jgi:D-erythrose 4-phosphate dehydrogenase